MGKFQSKLDSKGLYWTNIKDMRFELTEFYIDNKQAKKISFVGLRDGWEDIDGVLQHSSLSYLPEIICPKLSSCYYNDLLKSHFDRKKTKKLIFQK